ncbi:MAG: FumA C-terminus/TtdB family hydratase beta subunit [Deltaproteobacteria bacterium]|jgi:tartrate/fumarate subfamily iron-sulfur-dependent hydro-lyase beta chain|nr:FumA C-terminus/TtdB family hydratase beta subunit [Deltaproteobacteria bacterium]
MNKSIHLTTPLSAESVRKLKVNDLVTLTGTIYTARDMAHLRLRELKEGGKPLPEALEGSVIFHAGPVVKKTDGGFNLLNIGPTTSIRMEPHSDFLGRLGVRAIVGKGGLGDGSVQAFKKYGMVYLLAAPGCGVLHAQAVKQVMRVHWLEEMGMPEAIWVLEVNEWGPLMVGMDSAGASIFQAIKEEGLRKLDTLVKEWK